MSKNYRAKQPAENTSNQNTASSGGPARGHDHKKTNQHNTHFTWKASNSNKKRSSATSDSRGKDSKVQKSYQNPINNNNNNNNNNSYVNKTGYTPKNDYSAPIKPISPASSNNCPSNVNSPLPKDAFVFKTNTIATAAKSRPPVINNLPPDAPFVFAAAGIPTPAYAALDNQNSAPVGPIPDVSSLLEDFDLANEEDKPRIAAAINAANLEEESRLLNERFKKLKIDDYDPSDSDETYDKKEREKKKHRRGRGGGGGPPKGPPAPNQPPAPPPPIPPKYTGDFVKNAMAYAPLVQADTLLVKRLQALGIYPTQHPKDWVGVKSPHPISAAIRKLMTVRALGMFQQLKRKQVISLYGHKRDIELYNFVLQRPRLVDPREVFELSLYQPEIAAQDIVRRTYQEALNDSQNPFGNDVSYLMVDVYDTEFGPLTPALVHRWLQGDEILVWVGHRFRGSIGHAFNEGIWCRHAGQDPDHDQDLITFYPDAHSQPYAAHSACDWIWRSQSADGVSWAYKEIFGDYVMVVFKRSCTLAHVQAPQPGNWSLKYVDIPSPPTPGSFGSLISESFLSLMSNFPSVCYLFWPREQVLLNHELAKYASELMAMRQISPYMLKNLMNSLREKLDAEPIWRRIAELFPEYFELYTEKIVLAVLVGDLPKRYWLYQTTSLLHGARIQETNLVIKNFGTANPPTWSYTKAAVFGMAGLGVLWAFKRVTGRFPSGRMFMPASTLEHFQSQVVPYVTQHPVFELFLLLLAKLARTLKVILINLEVYMGVCVLTPIIEEFFKSFVPPYTGYIFGLFEFIVRLREGHGILLATPALLFHLSTAHLPYRKRVIIHMIFNSVMVGGYLFTMAASPGWLTLLHSLCFTAPAMIPFSSAWEAFAPLLDRRVTMDEANAPEAGIHPFRPELSQIDHAIAPVYDKPLTHTMTVLGEFIDDETQNDKNKVTWIMPTNFPMFVPSRTDHNLSQTIKSRILVDPPLDPEVQLEHWQCIYSYLLPFLPRKSECAPLHHEDWVAPWLAKFDSSRYKRYMAQDKRKLESMVEVALNKGIEVMVKCDEAISKLDEKTRSFIPKPRLIATVEPEIQYYVGPIIFGATQRLKEFWTVHHPPMALPGSNFTIHITWGSGNTDVDLSNWMKMVHIQTAPGAYILAAGDDSLVAIRDESGKLTFYEGDARMYDQSQSYGPLHAQRLVFAHLGANLDFVKVISRMSGLSYVAQFDDGTRVTILRYERPTRDTGGPDTTFGNTIVMILSWVYVICSLRSFGGFTLVMIESQFKYLGLDMKLKATTDPTRVTFLKGAWFPARHPDYELIWGHLPSRILKIGKSFRNPRSIYRHMSFPDACKQFLLDQGTAQRVFLQTPLVRAFVYKWAQWGGSHSIPTTPEWAIKASGMFKKVKLDEEGMADFMWSRYQISWLEVLEMETMILQAEPFDFLVHPGFIKMGCVDYALGSLVSDF